MINKLLKGKMLKTNNLARHGDLSFRRVDKMPVKGKKVTSFALALGEVTGHSHKLVGNVAVAEFEGFRYLNVLKDSTVSHEEHKTITLEPGVYKVITEREFDYFGAEIRKVVD